MHSSLALLENANNAMLPRTEKKYMYSLSIAFNALPSTLVLTLVLALFPLSYFSTTPLSAPLLCISFASLFSFPSSSLPSLNLLLPPPLYGPPSPPLSSSSSVMFMVQTVVVVDSFPIVLWDIADLGVLLRKGLPAQLSARCQEGDFIEDGGFFHHLLTTVRCREGERLTHSNKGWLLGL